MLRERAALSVAMDSAGILQRTLSYVPSKYTRFYPEEDPHGNVVQNSNGSKVEIEAPQDRRDGL